jgi:hypothetical protein
MGSGLTFLPISPSVTPVREGVFRERPDPGSKHWFETLQKFWTSF